MQAEMKMGTWRIFLPEVIEMLQEDPREIPEALEDLHPADVGELMDNLPLELIPRFLDAFPTEQAADFFEYTSEAVRIQVIPLMDLASAAALLDAMEPDEQAAIVAQLPEDLQQSLIKRFTPAKQEEARQILQYADNTAGRIMTTEYISVPPGTLVRNAIQAVRIGLPTRESYHNVYVVDGSRLLGVLSIRDLLIADENILVDKVLERQVISVLPEIDQEQVAKMISRYDLLSIPVVNGEGKMLGVVTVDDVIDVLVEEGTEDIQKLGAVEPLEYPYFQTGFWTIFRKRIFWLILLFCTQFFTGTAMRHYSSTLENALSLVFFIPLIISSGGNAGSQSCTIITRGLATGDITLRHTPLISWREATMGFVMGLVLGVIGIGRALLWDSGPNIAMVVGLSLMCVVIAGTAIGAILPMGLKKMGFDPAISSSPFIASFVDVCGIMIYFNIARWLL
jgi:magnesium transporter